MILWKVSAVIVQSSAMPITTVAIYIAFKIDFPRTDHVIFHWIATSGT
jgi:hypothetical protein